jgi:hypothetical protein
MVVALGIDLFFGLALTRKAENFHLASHSSEDPADPQRRKVTSFFGAAWSGHHDLCCVMPQQEAWPCKSGTSTQKAKNRTFDRRV